MLKPHVMEITVEGDAITEDELNDGSWTAFEAQRKYSRRNTSAATPSANCTEGASPEETAKKPPRYRARQPTLPRRRPLPKLPEEHLKVVIRPQGAINMRDCGSAAVLQAVCAAIDADAEDVLKNDQIRGKSTTRNTEATSKWNEPTETPFMEVSNTEDGNTAYRDALCRSRPVTRKINQGASGARTNSAHHRSGSRHRSNSRPRGDNRQRPASMTEKDQEPGKSVLRQPSTPDDAERGRRPEDTQVRELAAEIRNLKKQLAITNDKLAAANEEIKFLKSKQTKITTTPPATREILVCVRKDDSQAMEVVEGRNPKRKLVEPTSMAAPDTSGPTTLTKRMDKLEEFLNNFVQEVDNRMQVMQETMQKGIETCMVLIAKQSSATQTGHSSKEVQPSAAVIALTPNPPAKSNNMKGLKMVTSFPTRAEPYAKGNDGGIN
ncbi:hypothetical protein HPB49_007429 [Dermacentor silvarum]|uniref:Uncharacterized protein n=1 Tax=Dermacentor silvarum TaxID=543639 RepID=A0ACB8DWK9_DERSI|nr:hypothetical protein HPB49_007429 [Dermacentor silvarum]